MHHPLGINLQLTTMIDYSSFSLRTLRQMCRGQCLRVTPSNGSSPTQQDYINALKAATTSRNSFMTLPGELRNMIYREMLIFKDQNSRFRPSCSPQILRCNRQIKDEATDILYKENDFVIELDTLSLRAHGHRCGTFAPLDAYLYRRGEFARSGVQVGRIKWPTFLLRAARIHFKVAPPFHQLHMARSFDISHKIDINHTLYWLCSFLSTRSSLRELEVDLHWPGNTVSVAEVEGLCSPLIMLGPLDSLKIRTTDRNVTRFSHTTYTNPSIAHITHTGSVLPSALALTDEAEAYMYLAKAVQADTLPQTLNPSQPLYPTDWARLRDALAAVTRTIDYADVYWDRPGRRCVYNDAWEREVTRVSNDLRLAFINLDVSWLFGNVGTSYDDEVESLQEWRRVRWALRSPAMEGGDVAAVEQTITLSTDEFDHLRETDRKEDFAKSVWEKLDSYTDHAGQNQRSRLDDVLALRFLDDDSEWLPPGSGDGSDGDFSDDSTFDETDSDRDDGGGLQQVDESQQAAESGQNTDEGQTDGIDQGSPIEKDNTQEDPNQAVEKEEEENDPISRPPKRREVDAGRSVSPSGSLGYS